MRHDRTEPVKFVARDGSSIETRRAYTGLSGRFALVGAGLVRHSPGGWLAYKSDVPGEEDIGGTPEQLFASFLNGHKVPFHWRDRRNNGIIQRTYFGWQVLKHEHYDGIMVLPLDGIEAAQYGSEVLQCLPSLFEGFSEALGQVDFAPALGSMWIARGLYLDHRMAVASVGVEQILRAWRAWKKAHPEPEVTPKQSFWRDEALKKLFIQDGLLPVLNKLLEDNRLTHLTPVEKQELSVLRSRLESAWRPKNETVLATPFAEAGLILSESEIEAIKRRDPHLHGESLDYPLTTADLDLQAIHFDSLCMLITKFVLKLSRYKGPYRDFASRPMEANFEIKRLP